MLKYLLNLQLFADGGDGGDGGASPEGEGTGAEALDESMSKELASIPEKARKFYPKNAKANAQSKAEGQEDTNNEQPQGKPSYADLIKSDDYKEAHKEYMEKTINDRLKKYKDIESKDARMTELLQTIGLKYGIDANSETFLDDVAKAIDGDESYYEQYAIEHDMTPADARKIVEMERKVTNLEAEREEQARQVRIDEAMRTLRANAEQTKAQYPNFDLDVEMSNETFRNICAVTNGDTTGAYMAVHREEVLREQALRASRQAQIQASNAINANGNRPIESGMSGSQPIVSQTNFRKMNLQQLREQAAEWKRQQR